MTRDLLEPHHRWEAAWGVWVLSRTTQPARRP